MNTKALTVLAAVVTATLIQGSLVFADQADLVRPDAVFTPKGFDSNDNAQIILAGSLTNFCQKIAPAKFKVDYDAHKIIIENFIYSNTRCPSDQLMFVPYTSVVNLGNLPEGNYTVLVKNTDAKLEIRATLPITEALIENSADELLYASVEDVSFRYKDGSKWPFLTLKGIYSSSCLTLKSVLVHPREGNVVEVLPITLKKGVDCKSAAKPIHKEVELVDFPAGKVLIHVRTMNGMALNKVITLLDRAVRW